MQAVRLLVMTIRDLAAASCSSTGQGWHFVDQRDFAALGRGPHGKLDRPAQCTQIEMQRQIELHLQIEQKALAHPEVNVQIHRWKHLEMEQEIHLFYQLLEHMRR